MKKITLIILAFALGSYTASAQTQLPDGRSVVLTHAGPVDTIPMVNLPSVVITSSMSEDAFKRLQAYNRLKRDVKKTLPYAKLASAQLMEMNAHMATLKNERARRKFARESEKKLKDQFGDELKSLTINQGRILMKLIDRETGNNSYDLVKDLRGSFHAFIWQGVARFFGSNMKSGYDAEGEDETIESIIQGIESGEIK